MGDCPAVPPLELRAPHGFPIRPAFRHGGAIARIPPRSARDAAPLRAAHRGLRLLTSADRRGGPARRGRRVRHEPPPPPRRPGPHPALPDHVGRRLVRRDRAERLPPRGVRRHRLSRLRVLPALPDARARPGHAVARPRRVHRHHAESRPVRARTRPARAAGATPPRRGPGDPGGRPARPVPLLVRVHDGLFGDAHADPHRPGVPGGRARVRGTRRDRLRAGLTDAGTERIPPRAAPAGGPQARRQPPALDRARPGPAGDVVLHRLGRVLHRLVERVFRVVRGMGPQHRWRRRGFGLRRDRAGRDRSPCTSPP